jgi:magnesium transporter
MALSFHGGAGEVDRVAEAFDRHALTVEDVRHEGRPKTELFTDETFTLLKDAERGRGEQSFEDERADEPSASSSATVGS